jgi:hypothetical protein
MLVLEGGTRVVVSEPDRDRVLVVDLAQRSIVRTVIFAYGADPGRIAQDPEGRVHVVLRGEGAVASFDPRSDASETVRPVCGMPRGIAYDPSAGALQVACRDGELVTLAAAPGGDVLRRVVIDRDLRDVIVSGGRIWVTRFRSAEILAIDESGAVAARLRPGPNGNGTASVAWRAIGLPDGSIAILHQYSRSTEIGAPAVASVPYYGAPELTSCDGIVAAGISFVRDGAIVPGPHVAGAVLPVDVAPMPAGFSGATAAGLAVVSAGDQTGLRSVVGVDAPMSPRCAADRVLAAIPSPVAVAFAGDTMIVQQRDPAQLSIVSPTERVAISLGGASPFDTGHALFHGSTTAGLACASCHPEGGDDGHVWTFTGVGPRRTPALHGVRGTAPFHWTGELATFQHLVDEVFVRRMGGPSLDAPHAAALEEWLDHVPPPRARGASADAIARGRAVFEGEAQCASCHAGPLGANGASADVGTGGAFQVPSLAGVADRLPVMHSGCATTLAQRFDPACGGDRHGAIDGLAPDRRADLLAYLESL